MTINYLPEGYVEHLLALDPVARDKHLYGTFEQPSADLLELCGHCGQTRGKHAALGPQSCPSPKRLGDTEQHYMMGQEFKPSGRINK